MSTQPLGIIPGPACAITRFADALLRSLGGTQVTLRLSDPSTGDTASQLGLTAPTAEDIQISPAVVKPVEPEADGRRRIEVVVSATSMSAIAKTYGVEDVSAWLLNLQGVLHYGVLLRIAAVAIDHFHGKDCLYHLTATE